MNKVICIGELLWDMIPSKKMVGGAPFNVAYHLKKFGTESIISTRVGNDLDGIKLIEFVKQQKIDTSYIQVDHTYPTSTVNVLYDSREGVTYEIVKPVAWDFMKSANYNLTNDDYLVYGSLIFRNDVSKHTVLELIKSTDAVKVFDVNLRHPHYDKEILFEVLRLTDILKINEDELNILAGWIGERKDLLADTELLLNYFGLKEIICTLGNRGAYYCSNGNADRFFVNALKIDVEDTIGSGDSFLAGFLSAKINQEPVKQCLQFAVSLAGFISSQKGGCPSYSLEDFKKFQNNNPIL